MRLLSISVILLNLLILPFENSYGSPSDTVGKLVRDGQARVQAINIASLPPGTSEQLYSAEIVGNTFEIFARDIKPQLVTLELGFVDTQSKGAQEITFSLSANGSPIDANLDVWSKAGGAFKPWVMTTTFNHPGGALALQFAGLSKPAFVSYIRISDASGHVLAFGTANDWLKPERLTLLDSRFRPFHQVKVGDVAFYDVDHSPVGSWSTFIYGMEASGGVQVCRQPGGVSALVPDEGVIIGVKDSQTTRIMPFTANQKNLSKGSLISEAEVKRTLGACTDNWTIPLGVSWNHYTPVWAMQDWDKASDEERRRFVLPVTWMQYHIDNRDGKEEKQLLFSLQQPAEKAVGWDGFDGYVVDQTSSIAVKTGDADLITADQAKQAFGVDGATSAFCVHVPAGSERAVTFYIAQYVDGTEATLAGHSLKLMCDVLYPNINDILKTAQTSLPAVIAQCAAMDKKLADCGQDDERRFLAADALHSYQYNTVLHADENKRPIWAVIEGECSCINTFDLTIDHVFYELSMHPWTVKNELNNFRDIFSFNDELTLPDQTNRIPGGLGFCHDMGSRLNFSTHEKGAHYPTLMTQEELQNWIVCAALYWKTTGDNAWLEQNRDTLKQVLRSMQERDDSDPAKRDGITTYISNYGVHAGEITTYDAMDKSLRVPQNSLYTTVRSFACYAMLGPVFQQLGDSAAAKEANDAEVYTAKGLNAHWNESTQSFPASFDGKSTSSIIPAIEGLAYPYAMGLTKDVALDGPNAELIKHLKTHLSTILVPGVCIDSETGAWNLSSSSSTTWVSKVYLNQYVAENILGVKNVTTGANADSAHFAYEVLGAPAVCWSDQFYTSSHVAYGCRHYPRGVTSALWWLWPPSLK